MTESGRNRAKATASDALEILGPMPDARVAVILAAGAPTEQLEEATAWAAGESNAMGDMRRPVAGLVADVYELLTADEALAEDRD